MMDALRRLLPMLLSLALAASVIATPPEEPVPSEPVRSVSPDRCCTRPPLPDGTP